MEENTLKHLEFLDCNLSCVTGNICCQYRQGIRRKPIIHSYNSDSHCYLLDFRFLLSLKRKRLSRII